MHIYVGFLAGCYPGLALATAIPQGKCIGLIVPKCISVVKSVSFACLVKTCAMKKWNVHFHVYTIWGHEHMNIARDCSKYTVLNLF